MAESLALHIVESLDYGGVERVLRIIGTHENSSKFSHVFCAIGQGGAVARHLRQLGLGVFVLGEPSRIPSLIAVVRLWVLIRRIRPAVVHCHGAEANFHGLLASFLARVPVRLCEEIGVPEHSPLARQTFRLIYILASAVIAVSGSTKSAILALAEVRESKLRVVPNPVLPMKQRPTPPINHGRIVIGFVGRLEPKKNPLVLLDVLEILRKANLNAGLIVVGSGSLEHEMVFQLRSRGLEGCVEMVGYLDEPFDALGKANLFLQPSKSEGLSVALLEAMSAGIPCLVSPHGGGPEAIQHGITGWVLESIDPETIAKEVAEIMAMPSDKIEAITNSAKLDVDHRFDPETYISALDKIYVEFMDLRR